MRYIGVDLHKTNFVVCFLSETAKAQIERFSLDEGGLAAFRRRLRSTDEVAVEVGQNVYYFYEQIRMQVKQVALVDPYRFTLVSRSKKKTDQRDATLLAKFLKLGWLPTVPIPTERIRQLRQLFQAREGLVEVATKLKNMGHGALTRNGIALGREAFATATSRQRLVALAGLPAVDQQILHSVLRQLSAVADEVAALERTIVQLGKALPGLKQVLQLPGLNVLSGIGLLAEIGDLRWFDNAKQLVAYAGLATAVRQSSERERHGKLTKQGRKRLRSIAIRAALSLARQTRPSPLQDFYLKKKQEKGAGKALCAAARKLLTLVFVMLKKNLDYWYLEDRLYNQKLRVLQAVCISLNSARRFTRRLPPGSHEGCHPGSESAGVGAKRRMSGVMNISVTRFGQRLSIW